MKTLSSHRIRERERRYPFYVAFDLTVHWTLCLALFACAALLLGVTLVHNSPELSAQVSHFMSRIW